MDGSQNPGAGRSTQLPLSQTLPMPDPELLRRVTLFAGLDTPALQDVLKAGHTRTMSRGDQGEGLPPR